MPIPRSAGLLPGALFLAASVAGAEAPANTFTFDPGPAWRHAAGMPDLVEVLEAWLDGQVTYPRKSAPPRIVTVDAATAAALPGVSARMGLRPRGLYDPDTATIYLIEPWRPDRARDVSVLLHELVHHRQAGARHWYCPGAQEPEAYDLQAAWLAERGYEIAVNRIAIVLEAGCTPKDVHPD